MANFKVSEGNDKQLVERFLTNLRDFLDEIIEEHDELFAKQLISPMRDAWKDAKPRFNEVLEKLKHTDESVLKHHGLTGPELTFKLKVVEYLWENFRSNFLGKVLKRLLKAMDNVLDSILAALGLPNPIKEMKDGVDASIVNGLLPESDF